MHTVVSRIVEMLASAEDNKAKEYKQTRPQRDPESLRPHIPIPMHRLDSSACLSCVVRLKFLEDGFDRLHILLRPVNSLEQLFNLWSSILK